MRMAVALVWFYLSVAALVPQISAELSAVERNLYAQLEDALVNDGATLEQLREVFLQESPRPNEIHFRINITADSIPANNCSVCHPPWCWQPEPAFCPVNEIATPYSNSSTAQWQLCSLQNILWSTKVDAVEMIEVVSITVVPWCAHGPSLVVLLNRNNYMFDSGEWSDAFNVEEPIKLSVKKLNCQPDMYHLTNTIWELFSWIEVYTDAGGKPQSWNPQQQADVFPINQEYYWLIKHYGWREYFTPKSVYVFGMVGCFLLTLSLLLLIPRLFFIYHNKLAIKQTSPGSRSLYWGTAAFSLFLAFAILLDKLYLLSDKLYFVLCERCFLRNRHSKYLTLFVANLVAEVFILIVFLLTSLFTSRNNRAVPMPAAKFTTHMLFCCCFCFCCSSRCKSKGVQVLALWAFMTFIYYHITEAVALVFTFFISIPLTISYTLTYVSAVFFAIMLLSIILFSCQSTGRSQPTQAKCLGVVDVCAALLIFGLVILVIVAVIAIFTNLDVLGIEAVSLKFSLLPSLALSVTGWFIRKKLLKKDSHTVQLDHPTNHGATGYSSCDGRLEDEDEQSPEEQQYLLA